MASALVANFLFMEPRYTFLATPADTIGTVLFIVSSTLVLAVGQTLRRAVSELEATRDQAAHLNRELQHRVKNTLSVVQGLAAQTLRGVPEAHQAMKQLHGRIRALADANDILRDGSWEECRLPVLAERALEPFNATGAVLLAGPECSMPEESCVPLVLALHELATNAVKYGGLSTDKGTVELTWVMANDSRTRDELTIQWKECGGPPVRPPKERGLGSRLLRAQPGLREVCLAFGANGVTCHLRLAGVRYVGPGILFRQRPQPACSSPEAPNDDRVTNEDAGEGEGYTSNPLAVPNDWPDIYTRLADSERKVSESAQLLRDTAKLIPK